MTDGSIFIPSQRPVLPGVTTQTAYFLTGAFAGLCTVPVEYALKFNTIRATRATSPLAFLRAQPTSTFLRPAVRFWVFCLGRSTIQHLWPPPPTTLSPSDTFNSNTTDISRHFRTALIGGVSGGMGGFSELVLPAFFLRGMETLGIRTQIRIAVLPTPGALASQSSRLFLCFGTYTLLSSIHSGQNQPPRPFWKCWTMGAVAGAVGSSIVAAVEQRHRSESLGWRGLIGVAGRGSCVIGTVIGVQVTSCAWVLERLGRT